LNARIYHFPASAIKFGGRKINYHDFLTSGQNKDCMEAVRRIVPRIDTEAAADWISGLPYISPLQKTFYSWYLKARYELILQPTLELALKNEECQGFVMDM